VPFGVSAIMAPFTKVMTHLLTYLITYAHDILTRNWYQKTCTSFWYVCHAIWYQFLSVLFSARIW